MAGEQAPTKGRFIVGHFVLFNLTDVGLQGAAREPANNNNNNNNNQHFQRDGTESTAVSWRKIPTALPCHQ